jgi:hypothetical protein
MAVRFRKSINIGGGTRINLNKKSIGVSAGVKGARITANSNGRKTGTVGIPGTGLYSTTVVGKSKSQSNKPNNAIGEDREAIDNVANNSKSASLILKVVAPVLFILSLILTLAVPAAGVIGMVIGVVLFLAAHKRCS